VKVYSGENIRNVAIVGHGHAGKTTLVSAMLATAGATPRFGRVDDGTSTTDYGVGQNEDQRNRHSGIQHVCARSAHGVARD
jgi:elongation factor G